MGEKFADVHGASPRNGAMVKTGRGPIRFRRSWYSSSPGVAFASALDASALIVDAETGEFIAIDAGR